MSEDVLMRDENRETLLHALRWKKFPQLDDGFVCLVDAMGDDASVVQAARVSYGKDRRVDDALLTCDPDAKAMVVLRSAATKVLADDRSLIRRLMRDRHTTPFEMVELKFLVRCPMDCWRQWIRHRAASVNEYSTRYSVAIDAAQKTAEDQWRLQSKVNKQGSAGGLTEWLPGFRLWSADETGQPYLGGGHDNDPDHRNWLVVLVNEQGNLLHDDFCANVVYWFNGHTRAECTPGRMLSLLEAEQLTSARDQYELRLALGVAREQARKDLPLSTYTEAYWKIDLHNLLHFLGLRMDKHAQKEIREYAITIGEQIVAPLFPLVWEAFQDFRLGGLTLSRLDVAVVQQLAAYAVQAADADRSGPTHPLHWTSAIWPADWQKEKSSERDECLLKLERLGLIPTRV